MPRPEVFLSHASADKESVKAIALQLQQCAIPTWLDEWNLVPGEPWLDSISQALRECSGCVVFLGPSGAGPWHHEEVRSALTRAVLNPSFRVVPVLLPGTRPERLSHLPEFLANRQWVSFSQRLDDVDAIHRLVCGIRGVEPGPSAAIVYTPGRNPYRGLRVFDVEDAPLFFGREVLAQELLAKLEPSAQGESRFVSIVGPSGSGKSSLARAGLLAALRGGGLPGSAEWPQVILRPGVDPLESLALGIARKLAPSVDPGELIRRFKTGEEALHRHIKMALQDRPKVRAVLLVDQAEEAFTLGTPHDDRTIFFSNLVYAATVRTGPTFIVLAFRSDFYSRFAEHRQLAALVSENQLLVPSMAETELRRAITLPAARSSRPLRPTLVDELIRDAQGRPGTLPLLENTLTQLWARPEVTLGIEEYRSIGGLVGALNTRAEEIYDTLSVLQQAACRRLFLRLVQPGDSALDTRRRIRGTDLPKDQREVSQAFAAEGVHLLTWSREGDHDFVEVAHEEIIRSWVRLRKWAEESRTDQHIHRRLAAAAAEWNTRRPTSRDESFLYRGAALAEVEEWLKRLPNAESLHTLNSVEALFLGHSRAARDRTRLVQEKQASNAREHKSLQEAREQLAQDIDEFSERQRELQTTAEQQQQETVALARRSQTSIVVSVMFVVLAAFAAAIAIANASTSKSEAERAAREKDLAKRRIEGVQSEAIRTAQKAEALKAEAEALRRQQAIKLSRRLITAVKTNLNGDLQLNLALLKELQNLALTHGLAETDKEVLTTLAQLDNIHTRIGLHDRSGSTVSGAYNPDGHRVIAAIIRGNFASRGYDGVRVITASGGNIARVWEGSGGKALAILSGHSGPVISAAFNVDGLYAVTASSDHTARVWTATTGTLLATLSGHSGPVVSAAFSPDSLHVVTTSSDNTARIWAFVTKTLLATLSGHSGPVVSAAFSPDGLHVVTASEDNTARIWGLDGRSLVTLSGHSGRVMSAAFSPDGLHVVTASEDNTARIWGLDGMPLVTLSGHSGHVMSAAFSPDNLNVVTASSDRTARVWETSTGKLLTILSGHSASVQSAAFSLGGTRIVTTGSDYTVRVWQNSSWVQRSALSEWVQRSTLSESLSDARDLTPEERRTYLDE